MFIHFSRTLTIGHTMIPWQEHEWGVTHKSVSDPKTATEEPTPTWVITHEMYPWSFLHKVHTALPKSLYSPATVQCFMGRGLVIFWNFLSFLSLTRASPSLEEGVCCFRGNSWNSYITLPLPPAFSTFSPLLCSRGFIRADLDVCQLYAIYGLALEYYATMTVIYYQQLDHLWISIIIPTHCKKETFLFTINDSRHNNLYIHITSI